MYHCEVDNLYLIPTAEVPVTNIYRDVILTRRRASQEELRLLGMLPPRGRQLRQGCARPQPPAPVRQGGDRAHRAPRGLLRRPRGDEGPRAGSARQARPPLAHPAPLRRRHELHIGHHLRLRGMVRSAGALARSIVGIEFRDISGQPPESAAIAAPTRRPVSATRSTARHSRLPRIVAALLENNQTPEGIVVPECLRSYTGFDIID